MNNITHKTHTLRKAIATARLTVSSPATIEMIIGNKVPKGDVFAFSRAAGLLGIKKTADLIPDCHPLPIEYARIDYQVRDLSIHITVEVHTIYKTGVEVEAMHGASVVALTIYDMLKPVDKGIEISHIRLESKSGGKSDGLQYPGQTCKTAVIVCSDTVSAGLTEDQSGKRVIEKLAAVGIEPAYQVIPDEFSLIRETALQMAAEKYQLVFFTGGTGLSPRDQTPDAIAPLLTRQIPGIMETVRNHGQQRTPYAMLSRGVAGFIQDTLVITLPGSVQGVRESMDAIFPHILHLFPVAAGIRHEH
jgi:cyclic pyranopterin phosphate synthase